ncbi:MAG TPA: hypothetical protein VL727_19820 [Puia sp.]|nr:hypothetical protein [Puia sp.]
MLMLLRKWNKCYTQPRHHHNHCSEKPSPADLGLQNNRNRVRLTGESGIISSAPGEGTTVKVMMPYD